MENSTLNICIKVDNNLIYEFKGKIDQDKMLDMAKQIEHLLIEASLKKDKIKSVFELFIETVQNILSYSYKSPETNEIACHFSLEYFTEEEHYLFESCNLILEHQQSIIEQKLQSIQNLSTQELRKLIRKKSRSAEDRHEHGAGLGYLVMARKTSLPIEVTFTPYQEGILIYKQKLYI